MRDVTIKGTDQQRRTAEQMIEDLLAAKEREGPPPGFFRLTTDRFYNAQPDSRGGFGSGGFGGNPMNPGMMQV